MGELKASSLGKEPDVALSKAWKVLKKHQGIYGGGKVEVSKDGRLLGCMFGEDVVLVDTTSGQVTKVLSLGEDEGKEAIVSFTIRPDAQEVVTASRNLMIRYWDWQEGRCVRGFKAHETPVLAMEYDSTGTLLCTGSSDRTAKVWDVPGGFCTHNFRGHSGIITLVRFHPVAKRELLFTASDDTSIRVWSLARQACVASLTHHMSAVTGLQLADGGRTLVAVGRDQILSVWDVATDDVALLGTTPVYDVLEGVVVLGAEQARALVPTLGQQVEEEEPSHEPKAGKGRKRPLNQAHGAREGVVVVAGAKGVMKAYHYRSKADAFEHRVGINCVLEQPAEKAYPRGYTGLLSGSSPSPWLLAMTSDHNLQYCHVTSFDKQRVIIGFNDEIIDVRYLPRGRVAVATNSPQVRVLRLEDLSCAMQLEGPHNETVLSIDVSPDGRWLMSGSKDRIVCMWDLGVHDDEEEGENSGEPTCVMRCEGHTEAVGAVALLRRQHAYETNTAAGFSAGGDRTIKRWALKVKPGKGEATVAVREATATVLAHDKDINALAVAPNDALLASASQDKTVKLWDSKTLAPRGVLKGHKRGVWSVEFSPIDRCAITGSADRTIKVWSLVDHTCLKTFEGHGASVLKTACLRNGLQLLSVSSDGLMKLWTMRSQECEATFDEHNDRVWALALSPDGKEVVTGGGDSVLNVWGDVTAEVEEQEIRLAEELVQKEQALANYVYRKDYKKAIELAFELNRPLRLWKILQEVMEKPVEGEAEGASSGSRLDEFVMDWDDDAVGKVMSYVRDWNTNAKHVMVAQTLLNCLFRLIPFDRLKRCCASKPAILDGLLSYTDRHLNRADRILQSSYLVDFTLSSMHMLFGEDAATEEDTLRVGDSTEPPSPSKEDAEPVRRVEALISSSSEEEGEEEEDQAADGMAQSEEEEEERKEELVKRKGKKGKGKDKEKEAKPAPKQSPQVKGKGKDAISKKSAEKERPNGKAKKSVVKAVEAEEEAVGSGKKGKKRRASMDAGKEEPPQSRDGKGADEKTKVKAQEPQKKKQRRRSV